MSELDDWYSKMHRIRIGVTDFDDRHLDSLIDWLKRTNGPDGKPLIDQFANQGTSLVDNQSYHVVCLDIWLETTNE